MQTPYIKSSKLQLNNLLSKYELSAISPHSVAVSILWCIDQYDDLKRKVRRTIPSVFEQISMLNLKNIDPIAHICT